MTRQISTWFVMFGVMVGLLLPCGGCSEVTSGDDDDGSGGQIDLLDAGNGGHAGQGGTGGGSGGSCILPTGAAADGYFLLAASASLDPQNPILFVAQLANLSSGMDFELGLMLHALDAADRASLVGSVSTHGPFPVASNGSFVAALDTVSVPPDGNPFSDNELVVSPTLQGQLCLPADFICGDLTGTITAPITLDLTGSTFTMTRVIAGGPYPEPPVINCEGGTGRPL